MLKVRVMFSAFLAVMIGLLAAPAFATGTTIDTTAITDQLSANETALIAVGGAIIALAAVAVAFKWIKGMLFG